MIENDLYRLMTRGCQRDGPSKNLPPARPVTTPMNAYRRADGIHAGHHRSLRDIARDHIQGCARLSCRETAPDDFVLVERQPSVGRNQPGLKVPGKGLADQIGNYAEVNRYFMRREHVEHLV